MLYSCNTNHRLSCWFAGMVEMGPFRRTVRKQMTRREDGMHHFLLSSKATSQFFRKIKSYFKPLKNERILKDSFSVSYKTEHILTIPSNNCTHWYLSQKSWKLMSIQKPARICFYRLCSLTAKLKSNQDLLSRRMDK